MAVAAVVAAAADVGAEAAAFVPFRAASSAAPRSVHSKANGGEVVALIYKVNFYFVVIPNDCFVSKITKIARI